MKNAVLAGWLVSSWITLAMPVAPARAAVAWDPRGLPVCPRPECTFAQVPVIVSDGEGGAFVSWGIDRPYVQRLTPEGSVASGWPALGVAASAPEYYGHALLPDGAGGVYVASANFLTSDLFLQRIGPSASFAAGWPATGVPVSQASGRQQWPCLVADDAGGTFVVWTDYRAGGDIYASRIGSDGTLAPGWPTDGAPVCAVPYEQFAARAVTDGAGGFFASWSDGRTYPWDLYVQRIGSDGRPAPGWQPHGNLYRAGPTFDGIEDLAPDGAGGVYVLWFEDPYDSSHEVDLYMLRIAADGTISPGWPARGIPVCAAPGLQHAGYLTPDGAGGVIACWTDYRGGTHALRVRPDGTLAPGWPVNGRRVRQSPVFDWGGPLASDGQGGAYIATMQYGSNQLIYVQHLTAEGQPALGWPPDGLPAGIGGAYQDRPFITADGRGGCIVAWEDQRTPGGGIYAQKFGDDPPTSTHLTLVSAVASPDRVALTWHRADGSAGESTIHRSTDPGSWTAVGSGWFDASGRLTFEDRSVTAGRRYGYRLALRAGGAEILSEETWVEVPAALELALDGLQPNPAAGEIRVALTLPRHEPARLEMLDVVGRAVIQREVGSLGPGRHLVSLGGASGIRPGIYWLRLSTREATRVARATVIR